MKRKASESFGGDNETVEDLVSCDDIMVLINNGQSARLNEALENIEDINSKNDDSLLMRACRLGKQDIVKGLLSCGVDVSWVSHNSGHSALSLSCLLGLEPIVKLLLEHGAAARVSLGRLPLVEACLSGHLALVELLLDRGARIDQFPRLLCEKNTCNICNEDSEPLHYCLNAIYLACQIGNLELVRLLIRRGASLRNHFHCSTSSYNGYGTLNFASKGYHWDVVKLLVANGASINEICGTECEDADQDDYDQGDEKVYHWPPLLYACVQGDLDVVKELLDLGADINISVLGLAGALYHDSPLYLATAHGHLDLVKFILVHSKFKATRTLKYAFVLACQNRYTGIIEALYARMHRLDAFKTAGATPLVIACKQGYTHAIESLLAMGADIDAPTNINGDTALILACKEKNVAIVEFLLTHGALPDRANGYGETALSLCCNMGECSWIPERVGLPLKLMSLLVMHGADVNLVCCVYSRNTALMDCVTRRGSVSMVKLLLDYGADVTVKNAHDETVFDMITDMARSDDQEVIENESLYELYLLCKQYEDSNRQCVLNKPLLK